ncbi:MAG: M28 family peptidase [Anaerolineae bacterium]|nr:M28 family peptidase [Anaerolineae bacterium]
MEHLRVFCKDIGPRPACSPEEQRAAEYVRGVLLRLGLSDVQEQRFKSNRTYGWQVTPALAATTAAPLAASAWCGRLGRLVAAALSLGGAMVLQEAVRARPPFFQSLIAAGESQNLFVTIPPTGETWRRVILVAHLDSNKQRFMLPMDNPYWQKPMTTTGLAIATVSGLHLLFSALFGRRRALPWWQYLAALTSLGFFAFVLRDEMQPYIEGANDNGSALAALLGIAEALRAEPLAHTGVTLLFTGCEEAGCTGMDAYLKRYAPPKLDTYFIDLDMVGAGNVCYATKHGVSLMTEYGPHPEMLAFAARAAVKRPDLQVAGKDMLTVDEQATIDRYGYRGLMISSYNQEGYLSNWHRVTDTLENIEPATLSRAARFTWALLGEIDQSPPPARVTSPGQVAATA